MTLILHLMRHDVHSHRVLVACRVGAAAVHVTRPALREAFGAHARTLRQGHDATRGAA